ncbi:MAG: hypothetical protein Q7T61_05565 [Caulobacter sp.]|jgi:hypothetical protein|nr:hypothetical protein [Caulobacter sp.]
MGQMHQFEDVDVSTFTPDSLRYRQKASMLGQRASVESDLEKVRAMLDLAVSWIQLAENEELMASESRTMMF